MINAARADIATRRYDVVVMEDLSRAYRNPAELLRFIQFCVDHDTRVNHTETDNMTPNTTTRPQPKWLN